MSDEPKFTQSDLDAAIEAAKTALDTKNKELLDDLKKVKADLRKTQEINPADLERLESENDKLKADLATAQKTAKEAVTASEKATKALEAEQGVTHKLIAENGLVAELTKAGVTDPDYLEMAKMAHIGKIKIVTEGDERKAMYGDKPVADAIKEWAATDAGKKVVAAPVNSGGGGQGNNGGSGGTGKTMTRTAFDALDQGSRAGFVKEGGKVVDAVAA